MSANCSVSSRYLVVKKIVIPDLANDFSTFHIEERLWGSRCIVEEGKVLKTYKSEARDDAFESDVQSIDIDVNDETVYEIAGQEKLDGRAVTKVKITTPKDDTFFGVLKEEDEKIEELLNDTDFKKAYDAVKEEKNRVSYVWFMTRRRNQ